MNVMAANFVWLWMRLLLDQHQNGLEWLALVVLLVVTGLVLVLLLGQGGHDVSMETVGGFHTVLVACYHHQQHFLHDYYYYHFFVVVVVVVIPLWS